MDSVTVVLWHKNIAALPKMQVLGGGSMAIESVYTQVLAEVQLLINTAHGWTSPGKLTL
ncbi:hypothetical protein D3C73_1583920 [compost metagenome]